jgi:hypothetical protein
MIDPRKLLESRTNGTQYDDDAFASLHLFGEINASPPNCMTINL